MKLKSIYLDAVSTCTNLGYGREEWVELRKHSEVLSWHLSIVSKVEKIDLPQTSRVSIFAAEPPFSPKIRYLGSKAFVAVEAAGPEFLATISNKEEVYRFLARLANCGISLIENEVGIELAALSEAIGGFFDQGCVCKHTLASRRMKGRSEIEFRLEAEMTERFFQVDFVCYSTIIPEEKYRETIIKTFPSQTHLRPELNKIRLDGERVWIEGKIEKPRSQDEIDSGLGVGKDDHYYLWSRKLRDI